MIRNHRSAGSDSLTAAGSITEVAGRLDVAARTIVGWRTGAKVPSHTSRDRMRVLLGIPLQAWDTAIAPPISPPAPLPPESEPAPLERTPDMGATRRLREQLARLDTMRADLELSTRARLDIEKQITVTTRALAAVDILEFDAVVESPHAVDVIDRVMAAISPYPMIACEMAIALADFSAAPHPDGHELTAPRRAEAAQQAAALRAGLAGLEADHAPQVAAFRAANAALSDALAKARAAI